MDAPQDPYKATHKPHEPSVCPQCGAVFHHGRWQWSARPEGAVEHLCHACHRINDHYPAGILMLSGPLVAEHKAQMLRLARHQEEVEKREHPLNRIIDIEEAAGSSSTPPTSICRGASPRRRSAPGTARWSSTTTRTAISSAPRGIGKRDGVGISIRPGGVPMSADQKRRHRRGKPKRARRIAPAPPPEPVEALEPVFDEPATPPAKLNVSIEEPVPREPVAAEEDTSSPPEPDRTPASDLH
jgi:hypothetical protein